jgi:hypoxanthine-guanine phosphoribosyltransferase
MAAPRALSTKARKLYNDITKNYDLRPDELMILEAACFEVDLIDRLQEELDSGAMTVTGYSGQDTANPMITEVRQHRMALKSLLAQLKLPVEEVPKAGETAEEISAKARKAANARWSKVA